MESVLSIQVFDRSFIFRALAHLWNLLTELGYLDVPWPDLAIFVQKFGDGFAFQGSRSTLQKDGKRVLWSRYFYAFGIKYKDVPQLLRKLVNHTSGTIEKIRTNWYFVTRNWPLLHLLIDREARGLYGNVVGAVDAGLIAYATVVAPLIGQQIIKPQFGNNDDGTCIDNITELWKLYDRGPGLAGVDRLLAIKKGLKQELSINDVSYLTVADACVKLVDALLNALDDLRDSPIRTYTRDNTACKIKHISIDLLVADDAKKWEKVARVFEGWLGMFGEICTPAIVEAKKPVYPLPLRSGVVQLVHDIVTRRGLVEGVFTQEQEYGLGVNATYSWEDKIRSKTVPVL